MPTPLHKTELPDGRVLVRVGMCPPHYPGMPDAVSHVEALLAKEGIQAITHGSRAYAIEVLDADALRAIELLRTDPQRQHYGLTVFDVHSSPDHPDATVALDGCFRRGSPRLGSRHFMRYRYLLPLLGAALVVLGVVERGWYLLVAWLGCNVLALGIAHGRGWHRVFGKRADGTLPVWSWLLFLPLLTYASAVWRLLRLLSREPACSVVNEQLVVGRRLLPFEVEGQFDNFVDLTAEFSEPSPFRHAPSYRSFPILDGGAPTPAALRAAVTSLRPGRTFVHCAQGHGRSGLFALAVLLHSGAVGSVEDGLRTLCAVRPAVRLNREQRRCIQAFAREKV